MVGITGCYSTWQVYSHFQPPRPQTLRSQGHAKEPDTCSISSLRGPRKNCNKKMAPECHRYVRYHNKCLYKCSQVVESWEGYLISGSSCFPILNGSPSKTTFQPPATYVKMSKAKKYLKIGGRSSIWGKLQKQRTISPTSRVYINTVFEFPAVSVLLIFVLEFPETNISGEIGWAKYLEVIS